MERRVSLLLLLLFLVINYNSLSIYTFTHIYYVNPFPEKAYNTSMYYSAFAPRVNVFIILLKMLQYVVSRSKSLSV